MAGFDDAALRVVHQDDEPLTTPATQKGLIQNQTVLPFLYCVRLIRMRPG